MDAFDFALFGAGIAGASLAYRLAPHGRVVLFEREAQPGLHSTGRSAAMFIESYGPPQVRALTRASRDFYARPPPGFAEVPLLAPRGTLYVATQAQSGLLRDSPVAALPGIERLDATAARALVPCLKADVLLGALHERDALDIDVHALHQGFLRAFRAAGGELRLGATLAAAARAGAQWELRFADGEAVAARVVVDAAGAWADELAALFGAAPIGLEPRRRSAFTFKPPAGVDVSRWPAVVGIDESFYFKPDAGRLLGSPANADPVPPHDVLPEEIDIATGIDRIEAVTTLTIRRPESTWAGLRSFVRDGEIVIGFDDACPDFFWLAAQGGYGIQSAAGASALAAALVRRAPTPPDLIRHGVDAAAVSPQRLRI